MVYGKPGVVTYGHQSEVGLPNKNKIHQKLSHSRKARITYLLSSFMHFSWKSLVTSEPRGKRELFSLPGGSSMSHPQVYAGLCVWEGCRKQEGRSMKRKGMALPLIEPGPQHRRKAPSF